MTQNWTGSVWWNEYHISYTYDGNNNQTSKLTRTWSLMTWANYNQILYSYDDDNNQTNAIYLNWNGTAWEEYEHNINTYVGNFPESNSSRYFDEYGRYLGDSTFYYFHTVTCTKDVKEDDGNINVYPNPTSGKITISSNSTISAVEIYNLPGARIYSNSTIDEQAFTEIDLSTHGKGIYFVNIYDGTNIYNRKIVVQ